MKSRSECLRTSVRLSVKEENYRCSVSVEDVDREEGCPRVMVMHIWGCLQKTWCSDKEDGKFCVLKVNRLMEIMKKWRRRLCKQVGADGEKGHMWYLIQEHVEWRRRCTRWYLDHRCCGHQELCGCSEEDCQRKLEYLQGVYICLFTTIKHIRTGNLSLVPSMCLWGIYK